MKSAVYGYNQSQEINGKRTVARYFGYARSKRAFIEALLEIEAIRSYGNWNWVSERVGCTNANEIEIATKSPDKIFVYDDQNEDPISSIIAERKKVSTEVKQMKKQEKIIAGIKHEIRIDEAQLEAIMVIKMLGIDGIHKRLKELAEARSEIGLLELARDMYANWNAFAKADFDRIENLLEKSISTYKETLLKVTGGKVDTDGRNRGGKGMVHAQPSTSSEIRHPSQPTADPNNAGVGGKAEPARDKTKWEMG